MVSERGQVRRIGSQYLGKNLQPGTMLYNHKRRRRTGRSLLDFRQQ